MEFYNVFQNNISVQAIHQQLRIDNLDQYCASVNQIIRHHGNEGEMYCAWGQFNIQREILNKGIRISLLNCPNALTFSITREQHGLVIHCTINTEEADDDFIESIQVFLNDLQQGINQL